MELVDNHWKENNSLSDSDFMFDSIHTDREQHDLGPYEHFKLDDVHIDNDSLSTHFSVDVNDTTGRKGNGKDVQHVNSDVSLSEDEDDGKFPQGQIIVLTRPQQQKIKGNSNSKQAVAARENRQKKKQYISGLEAQIEQLRKDNDALRKRDSGQQKAIADLREEVSYLRNVIANQTALSVVLRNINKTVSENVELSLSSSLSQNMGTSTTGTQIRPPKMSQTKTWGVTNTGSRPSSSRSTFPSTIPGQKRKTTPSASVSDGQVSHEPFPASDQPQIAKKLHLTSAGKVANADQFSSYETSGNMITNTDLTSVPKPGCGDERVGKGGKEFSRGGICLHVLGKCVSVELCASCNRSAMQSCAHSELDT